VRDDVPVAISLAILFAIVRDSVRGTTYGLPVVLLFYLYRFLFFICDGCLLVVIFYALDLSGVREQVLEEEIIDKYY
jgi:hypothetical protein